MSNYICTKKAPLTCQSTHAFIVIRKNKEIPIVKIKEYCEKYFKFYYFIEHKGDISPITSEVEGTHYHIVGDFNTSKVAFSTRLNEICDFFRFEDSIGLEIDQYRSLPSAVQYLGHKNSPEKTPHKKEDIITNVDKTEFGVIWEATQDNFVTFDLIYSLCLTYNRMLDIIREIGMTNYRAWRSVIIDIFCDVQEQKKLKKKL